MFKALRNWIKGCLSFFYEPTDIYARLDTEPLVLDFGIRLTRRGKSGWRYSYTIEQLQPSVFKINDSPGARVYAYFVRVGFDQGHLTMNPAVGNAGYDYIGNQLSRVATNFLNRPVTVKLHRQRA